MTSATDRKDAAPVTQFRDWTIPGPRAPGGVELEDGESLDAISGHWKIFQRKKGHRYSTDDLVCAWYASQWAPRVERYCDLGSGIGSVAMMVAWRRPGCEVVTVEAQAESYRLQCKSLRFNGIEQRFTPLLADLRDWESLVDEGPFDLITGSPPYWTPGTALVADKPQTEGARLTMRGTVKDYAQTAARLLAPGGVFACVFQAAHDDKVRAAIAAADLALVRTRPVCFKASVPAAVSGAQLYLAARRADLPKDTATSAFEEPPLTIRDPEGRVDREYAAVKLSLGFPP